MTANEHLGRTNVVKLWERNNQIKATAIPASWCRYNVCSLRIDWSREMMIKVCGWFDWKKKKRIDRHLFTWRRKHVLGVRNPWICSRTSYRHRCVWNLRIVQQKQWCVYIDNAKQYDEIIRREYYIRFYHVQGKKNMVVLYSRLCTSISRRPQITLAVLLKISSSNLLVC